MGRQSACSKERRTETKTKSLKASKVSSQSACSKERRTETPDAERTLPFTDKSERMF